MKFPKIQKIYVVPRTPNNLINCGVLSLRFNLKYVDNWVNSDDMIFRSAKLKRGKVERNHYI